MTNPPDEIRIELWHVSFLPRFWRVSFLWKRNPTVTVINPEVYFIFNESEIQCYLGDKQDFGFGQTCSTRIHKSTSNSLDTRRRWNEKFETNFTISTVRKNIKERTSKRICVDCSRYWTLIHEVLAALFETNQNSKSKTSHSFTHWLYLSFCVFLVLLDWMIKVLVSADLFTFVSFE
jgi:hypothetical protein